MVTGVIEESDLEVVNYRGGKVMRNRFRIGEKVVYVKQKCSTCPSDRALNVMAAPRGETYEYQIEKYWLVSDVLPDGVLVLQTRRGKSHLIKQSDPNLRKASIFERVFRSRDFPVLLQQNTMRVVGKDMQA